MTRTVRLLATLIFGLLFTGVGGVVLETTEPVSAASSEQELVQAMVPATTSTTYEQVPVPTTAAPVQTIVRYHAPVRPVATPRKLEPIVEIGTIEIPKIGLVHRVMEGITMRNIDLGPSHWPGTAMPGQNGNAVFAGHRTTKTKPFRNIDQLVPGDKVIFTIGGVRSVYETTGHEVVEPTALRIINQTPDATATLFACHPPGSAKFRYVVYLKHVTE